MSDNMTTIWARLGVSLEILPEEMRTLACGSQAERENTLASVISQGRVTIFGDSYIPGDIISEYNMKHGTEYAGDELDLETGLLAGKVINTDNPAAQARQRPTELIGDFSDSPHPFIFEYGGYHFVPERKLDATENDLSKITRRQRIDFQMGLCKPGYAYESRYPYSHESFYAASPVKDCDLFRCVENGRLYIPCANDLQQYMEHPMKRRDTHER